MATLDVTARNSILTDFGADYATATLTILNGATPLVAHTLAGFAAASAGSMAASAIATAAITGAGTQTATTATLSAAAGTVTLTVGLSGADLNLSTLTYVNGETSTISSLVITKAAT